MPESRVDATDRLRREGRWAEASKFRDAKRLEFKAAGLKRTGANEAAWEAMLAEFPLSVMPEPKSQIAQTEAATIAAIVDLKPKGEFSPLGDVAWVYDHVGDDDLAAGDFPGLGAWSLWTWARGNRARFYESLWPKAEAAQAMRYEPLRDPAFVETVLEIEANRKHWMERMAEDLPGALGDLPENALWAAIPPESARVLKDRGKLLGLLMYQLSLRYVAAKLEPSAVG